jgi:hypothetical protein
VSSDFHGTDRHDGMAVQPTLTNGPPADRHHPRAYRIGLFVLAIGLSVTVFAVATSVATIAHTILLAVPLALIGIGLERIGRGEGKASLRAMGSILLVVAVLGPAVVALSPNRIVLDRLSAPIPSGTNQAMLRATPGSGQLRVGSKAEGLYTAELRSPGRSSAQVTSDSERAVLDLRAPVPRGLLARNRGSDWTVGLSAGLPWQVEVEAGTVIADLNLRKLDVRGVRVESGVSRLVVSLGLPTAEVPVYLQASSGLVDIYLPETAACEIRVDGISVDNFWREGLVKEGGLWQTTNTTQVGRYIFDVRISGGRVRLHRY